MRAFANLVEVAFHGAPVRMKAPAKIELVGDETISADGVRLRRIRALRDFGSGKAGWLGGYVEGLYNLSPAGEA
jgi:hypothetical protein